MATKRGFCPYCQSRKTKKHFFDVNPEAKVCFCPYCMREISPDLAIKSYDEHVRHLIRDADYALYVQGNPSLAYQLYAEVLEFEDYNITAFLGRSICLLYMSSVRRSYIRETTIMLEAKIEQYRKTAEPNKYVAALSKMNNVVCRYEEALYKKLTFRKYFYDTDCLKLYFKHVYDIILFKELLLKEARYISRRFEDQKAEKLVNLLEIKIDEQTHALKDAEYTLVDGTHHQFSRIKRNGEVEIIEIDKKRTNTRLSRYRMSSLDPNNKKCHYIKDTIFKDYTVILRLRKMSIFLFSILYLLAIAAGVTSIFFYNKMPPVFISLVIGGGTAFLIASVFIGLFIYWVRLLKNKNKLENF